MKTLDSYDLLELRHETCLLTALAQCLFVIEAGPGDDRPRLGTLITSGFAQMPN